MKFLVIWHMEISRLSSEMMKSVLRMRDYARAITDAFGLKPPRRVPRWLFRLVGGGPAKYLVSSQRVANARFKEKTGWVPKYRSAREGWQQIAQELQGKEN